MESNHTDQCQNFPSSKRRNFQNHHPTHSFPSLLGALLAHYVRSLSGRGVSYCRVSIWPEHFILFKFLFWESVGVLPMAVGRWHVLDVSVRFLFLYLVTFFHRQRFVCCFIKKKYSHGNPSLTFVRETCCFNPLHIVLY